MKPLAEPMVSSEGNHSKSPATANPCFKRAWLEAKTSTTPLQNKLTHCMAQGIDREGPKCLSLQTFVLVCTCSTISFRTFDKTCGSIKRKVWLAMPLTTLWRRSGVKQLRLASDSAVFNVLADLSLCFNVLTHDHNTNIYVQLQHSHALC